jgi:hypothetical protein
MAGTGVKRTVLDFMVAQQGAPVSTDLVAASTGLTKTQVNYALASFVIAGNASIVRVSYGVYSYIGPAIKPAASHASASRPAEPKNGLAAEPFTVIGKAKTGETVVSDANGVIYKLVEI